MTLFNVDSMPTQVKQYSNYEIDYLSLTEDSVDWINSFVKKERSKYTSYIKKDKQKSYGKVCEYCRTPCKLEYSLDHVLAVSRCGPTIEENLLPACQLCNEIKSDKIVFCDHGDGTSYFGLDCLLAGHKPNLMRVSFYIAKETLIRHGIKTLTSVQLWILDHG